MKRTVYIETTIPSFYHEIRPEPEMVARRNWTRQWWKNDRIFYELYTSEAVLEELDAGDYPIKAEVLEFVSDLEILEVNDDIQEIVEVYLKNCLMPQQRLGDALHLALASYYKCDFLLTWNCVHIANANKSLHIKIVNERLGLFTPTIVTPMELTGEDEE